MITLKKLAIAIAALGIIGSGALYPKTTQVISVNEDTDTVVLEDYVGHIWSFTGVEDWEEGDVCSLLMFNMGTSEIYDDVILASRYDGHIFG